jgi:riboflavin kinase/FMN adenylyltransferase
VKVLRDFPRTPAGGERYPVVTIGVFDGVHRGHQAILSAALGAAAGRAVAVVTFDPHPRAVLGPPKPHRLLSPLGERLDLLGRWPIAAVAVLRFDAAIAQQSYRQFVHGALVDGLGARCLVLGYNMRLGHAREGTPERLTALGQELGFEVVLVPAVDVDGEPASSTRVRRALDAGDVAAAARLLGRPYALRGTVVRGAGRGRTLGVPTANVEIPAEKLVPSNGVYAVWAQLGVQRFPAALNIGTAPTFVDAGQRSVEAHLLGYAGDLYGSRLELELVSRLRDERRFDGPDALAAQIQADLEAARRALQGDPPHV